MSGIGKILLAACGIVISSCGSTTLLEYGKLEGRSVAVTVEYRSERTAVATPRSFESISVVMHQPEEATGRNEQGYGIPQAETASFAEALGEIDVAHMLQRHFQAHLSEEFQLRPVSDANQARILVRLQVNEYTFGADSDSGPAHFLISGSIYVSDQQEDVRLYERRFGEHEMVKGPLQTYDPSTAETLLSPRDLEGIKLSRLDSLVELMIGKISSYLVDEMSEAAR